MKYIIAIAMLLSIGCGDSSDYEKGARYTDSCYDGVTGISGGTGASGSTGGTAVYWDEDCLDMVTGVTGGSQ